MARESRPAAPLAAIAILLSTGCAAPGGGQGGDTQSGAMMARDAVNFFGQLCLSTLGDRRAVEQRLAQSSHPVGRLPGATRAAEAWSEVGPHGAELRLEVDEVQFCSVDVAAASGPALHKNAQAMLDRMYGDGGFKYRIVSDEADAETRIRRQEYLLRLPSTEVAAVVVSTEMGGTMSPGRLSFGFSGTEY